MTMTGVLSHDFHVRKRSVGEQWIRAGRSKVGSARDLEHGCVNREG